MKKFSFFLVLFFIGDGMGLPQIAAVGVFNHDILSGQVLSF